MSTGPIGVIGTVGPLGKPGSRSEILVQDTAIQKADLATLKNFLTEEWPDNGGKKYFVHHFNVPVILNRIKQLTKQGIVASAVQK